MLNRQEWVKMYYPLAKQVTAGTGIFPEILLGQAILESSRKQSDGFFYPGTSQLAEQANNYFGIKKSKDWKGDVIALPTKEYQNGQPITVTGYFRKYPTISDSFIDYVRFLQTNPRYKKAGVFAAQTVREQAIALQKAGYATDPNYSNILTSVVNSFKKILPKFNAGLLVIFGAMLFVFKIFTDKNKTA